MNNSRNLSPELIWYVKSLMRLAASGIKAKREAVFDSTKEYWEHTINAYIFCAKHAVQCFLFLSK